MLEACIDQQLLTPNEEGNIMGHPPLIMPKDSLDAECPTKLFNDRTMLLYKISQGVQLSSGARWGKTKSARHV